MTVDHLDVATIPVAEVVAVTPAMAIGWLAKNSCNRLLRPWWVDALALDMGNGNWHLNGETIKIDRLGNLVDGQHRAHAVIAAEATVPMFVVTGVESDVRRTIDVGIKRTYADVLGMRAETNPYLLGSIVRRAVLWAKGTRMHMNKARPTHAELDFYLALHPECRDSMHLADRLRRSVNAFPSTLGLAHHLFAQLHAEQADWFFDRLADGSQLSPGHPILALRNRLNDFNDGRSRLRDFEVLALVILAWNATRAGEDSRQRVQLPRGGLSPERFPEPK